MLMAAPEIDRSIGLHVDFDGAASAAADALGLETFDARPWGPRLRMVARSRDVEAFYQHIRPRLRPFTLFGSGDFHHLSALWLRRCNQPFTLVMFDNHPDWDWRPPRWSCGGWLNRALELPNCSRIIVLGCGNFELEYPARLFGRKDQRLEIRPWAERVSPRIRERYRCLDQTSLHMVASELAAELGGSPVYISIDLDAHSRTEAVTNWESGLFTIEQLTSLITQLRHAASIIGGDICGGYSRPTFERLLQRLAHKWDHPKLSMPNGPLIADRNARAMGTLWRSLAGASALPAAASA
jgi:hypothetical protein